MIGNSQVGKSSFIKRHVTGDYQSTYVPTTNIEIHAITFNTTKGHVKLNLWDCAVGSNRDICFKTADAAVLMFSLIDMQSYLDIENWHRNFTRIVPNAPMCIAGNKCDLKFTVITPRDITIHRKLGLQFYFTSGKSNYDYEKPFLYLLRKLMNDETLQFELGLPIIPPSIRTSNMVTRSQTKKLRV
jgi:GTP-binding nuclear protein Ran